MKRHSIAVMGWALWDGTGRTPTGAAVASYELTKRLSTYFDCDMIFETNSRVEAGKTEDTNSGFRRRMLLRPKGLWRLDEDFLRDHDLIHIWDASPMFSYRAFTKLFLPHCYTLHSAASMTNWIGIASAFYVEGHDIVTLGSQCLAEALNVSWRVPAHVIPYGVDTEVFKPLDRHACRESLDLPKDSLILGYLGRTKKFDFALAYETLRRVKKLVGQKDVILCVAGGNREIRAVHVKDDFVYLGYLDKAKVPQFLNSCDVFFNPVAGIREGFGLTVVEAMSCGLPVVTAYWNGYRDTVSSDSRFLARTCWKDGDVWINQKDLVTSCVELIKNESLREEMARKARLRVEENYRWGRCVNEYRHRFLDLIHKGPPEDIPYKDAPEKITIRTDGKPLTLSLEEAFRNQENLRVDFQALHERFASDSHLDGGGWKKFNCVDNIMNLPKYRQRMKRTLEDFERQLSVQFPRLVRAFGSA